jgi:hypothetical protein
MVSLPHRRGAKAAIEDFQDLVKPILDACPAALDIKNQLGESGALVLEVTPGPGMAARRALFLHSFGLVPKMTNFGTLDLKELPDLLTDF